jgi:hypothetical protein
MRVLGISETQAPLLFERRCSAVDSGDVRANLRVTIVDKPSLDGSTPLERHHLEIDGELEEGRWALHRAPANRASSAQRRKRKPHHLNESGLPVLV